MFNSLLTPFSSISSMISSPLRSRGWRVVHNYDGCRWISSSCWTARQYRLRKLLKALQVLSTWIDILDEEDFSSDQLRVSMVSFSEPDQVIHEFAFSPASTSLPSSATSSTEYHGMQHKVS
ncbi:hypothetical protein EB796_024970 [Bugula neritina]|uniref:Uncharacterized protein n=1 Tax=Bugula neritina TaxID=10212 RepID=A0A7J7IS01_BUGNE|nr:hypothetical protein EB796_024970 [Bugula neritina]